MTHTGADKPLVTAQPPERPVVPVSVVVPCYRCGATVERAVASVAGQTVLPREVILVDDGSNDTTLNTLRAIRERYGRDWIRVIALPGNVGASGARNTGWDVASGEYIAFLDADDAWHPDKLRVQYAFMSRHPEFAVSGHGHRQVIGTVQVHDPVDSEAYERIAFWKLLFFNRFVTPSVMLKRSLPVRFRDGKRHMEDFLLWLTLAARGYAVAFLPARLAYIFKAPFGETGLSADIVAMEKGELDVYRQLHRSRHLGLLSLLFFWCYSGVKFLRRVLIALLQGRQAAYPWLFPVVYLTVTHSTTALLVIAGLFGQRETAADIGLVHGAMVATFYALSANTRSLILGRSAAVPVGDILLSRLVLCLPLTAAAFLLSVTGTDVPWWLAGCLILRRVIEWFNEIELCEAELAQRARFAAAFMLLQGLLFAAAAGALILVPAHAPAALLAWAAAPAFASTGLRHRLSGLSLRRLARTVVNLLSHAGSTAITGLSIYAFRVLVVLVAAKEIAGDLFTAFAIGSFMGTLFANAIGPSVELHRARTGYQAYPAPLRSALLAAVAAGAIMLSVSVAFPQAFPVAGKSAFFWQACGLSLIGGSLMVVAQDLRLLALRKDDGRDVFGPDVMIHVALVGLVPLSYFLAGAQGMAALYFANAVLSYVIYQAARWSRGRAAAMRRRSVRLTALLSFALTFPFFFLLSGRLYDSPEPVVDSGGMLTQLPLPVAIPACFLAILIFGRYRAAARSFGFVFLFFAAMLLATVISTSADLVHERGKILLLMQFLLPAFGLVLGEMAEDRSAEQSCEVERGLFWACALIVPAQLAATWLQGNLGLTHYLLVFSVYQHWQYVPVVLAAAALLAVSALWQRPVYRRLTTPLLVATVIYAVSAYSILATCLVLSGALAHAAQRRRERGLVEAALLASTMVALGAAMTFMMRDSAEFITKFFPTTAPQSRLMVPCATEAASYVSRLIAPDGDTCLVQGETRPTQAYLIALGSRMTTGTSRLVVEGEIYTGGVSVGLVQGGAWSEQRFFDRPGRFRTVFHPGNGKYEGVIANHVPDNGYNHVRIFRIAWEQTAAASPQPRAVAARSAVPDRLLPYLPRNLVERIEDWALFGGATFYSVETFLFGHAKPMDRAIRSSAHNYYLDLAYGFGFVALLPVLLLWAYTARLAWKRGREGRLSSRLLWLAALVAFFIVLDSNFKVTLRQPYPGLFAYFLWGLLLARLDRARPAPVTPPQTGAP